MDRVFQPNTPQRYRVDRLPEEIGFLFAFGPIFLGFLVMLVLLPIDYVLPGGIPDEPDLWIISLGIASSFLCWFGIAYWAFQRRRFTEEYDPSSYLGDIENKYLALPSDLQAEVSQLRALALEFERKKNWEGLQRINKVMNEVHRAWKDRDEMQKNREASNPELARVLKSLVQYRAETTHMFKGEIE